jgi:hypothetical protein
MIVEIVAAGSNVRTSTSGVLAPRAARNCCVKVSKGILLS